MQSTPFRTVVDHLTRDQIPRVWSFLISVFGELAQDKGARISGPLLRHITDQVGIKPEAMRVAIHRLRKDGWIDSERNGRTSAYFLTDQRRAQSISASPRIYASDQATDTAFYAMFNPGEPVLCEEPNGVWITSNVLITSVKPKSTQIFITPIHEETPLPHWMTAKICDENSVRMTEIFAGKLAKIKPHLDGSPDLSTLEIATIRVLLVHNWRRIVLKAPLLPDHVFPRDWRGPLCRAEVSELLRKYAKQGLDELESYVGIGPDQ